MDEKVKTKGGWEEESERKREGERNPQKKDGMMKVTLSTSRCAAI